MKTPRKTQKTTERILNIKTSTGGGPAFTLCLPGGKVALCPLSAKPLTLMCVGYRFKLKKLSSLHSN